MTLNFVEISSLISQKAPVPVLHESKKTGEQFLRKTGYRQTDWQNRLMDWQTGIHRTFLLTRGCKKYKNNWQIMKKIYIT